MSERGRRYLIIVQECPLCLYTRDSFNFHLFTYLPRFVFSSSPPSSSQSHSVLWFGQYLREWNCCRGFIWSLNINHHPLSAVNNHRGHKCPGSILQPTTLLLQLWLCCVLHKSVWIGWLVVKTKRRRAKTCWKFNSQRTFSKARKYLLTMSIYLGFSFIPPETYILQILTSYRVCLLEIESNKWKGPKLCKPEREKGGN